METQEGEEMTVRAKSSEGLDIYWDDERRHWIYNDSVILGELGMRIELFKHRISQSIEIKSRNPYPYLKAFLLLFYWKSIFGYCRGCGHRVFDFLVPNEIWTRVTGWNNEGLLCYQCFCKLSDNKGINYRMTDKNFRKVKK